MKNLNIYITSRELKPYNSSKQLNIWISSKEIKPYIRED